MKMDAQYWQRQLELADREERDFRRRGDETIKVYADKKSKKGPSRFNILWSNVETQRPALYSATPKQDVRRRYRQDDEIARSVAEILDRGLSYSMDAGAGRQFDRFMELAVLDYVLPGRMVGRVKYQATFRGEGDERVKVDERVFPHHVPWKHYRQSPASCWEDVTWVAYGDNFLTQEEVVEQYGKEHKNVPLHFSDDEDAKDTDEGVIKKCQVWQIWCKETKNVYEVVHGYDKFLDKYEDPLKLRDFFPQPEPVLMIETPGSLVPIPEYTMYQYQAEELNEVTKRITLLTRAMKAKGFYPGDEADKLEALLNGDDTFLIPVEDWIGHAEKGGVKGMVDWMPIGDFVAVWEKLILRRNLIIRDIFELTGISDIQRGSSDPRETKGAQMLKANFGNRRFIRKQKAIQQFVRDMLRLMGEVMAEHFSADTLEAMTGAVVTDEVMTMLRDDKLRSFAIDIETDSTIEPDDQLERQGAAEFLSAMSNFLNVSAPIVQAQPQAAGPLGSLLLWMSRKYKIARPIEAEVEKFVQQVQNMPQARNSEAEAKMAELQSKLQLQAQEKQGRQQINMLETQADIRRKDAESQAEIRRKDMEAQARMEREARELALKEREFALREGTLVAQTERERVKTVRERAAAMQEGSNGEPTEQPIVLEYDNGRIVGAVTVKNGVEKRFNISRQEADSA